MKVLMTVASKHGANREIAEKLVKQLREQSLDVDLVEPETVQTLEGYDAVIVGSGIYMGRWMKPARQFIEDHAAALRGRQVWLFSSGAIVPPFEPARDTEELIEATHAREHRLFGGRLDRRELSFLERVAVKAAKATDGDSRDWDAVTEFGATIATELLTPVAEPQVVPGLGAPPMSDTS